MMASPNPIEMASMPVQRPTKPGSDAAARARFFNSGNAFNLKLPPVPARIFADEAARALAGTSTGFIVCDQSDAIGCPFSGHDAFDARALCGSRPGRPFERRLSGLGRHLDRDPR